MNNTLPEPHPEEVDIQLAQHTGPRPGDTGIPHCVKMKENSNDEREG